MPRLKWLLPAAAMVLAACTGGASSATSKAETGVPLPPGTTTIMLDETTTTTVDLRSSVSPAAAAYLDRALDAMRQRSINRDSVDWETVEHSAFRTSFGAENPAGTYAGIRLALDLLNDEHSVFLSPSLADSFSHGPAVFVTPDVELRPEGLGYVSIGRYLGDIGEQADDYAADLAGRIEGVSEQACGWVVDLRSNTGGNMWPMLAGMAPLLGQGKVGSFTYPDGTLELWEITGSVATWDGTPMVDNSLESPASSGQPLAILISPLTGSSGEAVAVAFHGQDQVRFFGQPTAGKTTSNEPIELSDGAIIALTMSNFTDRLDHEFGQNVSVEPDQVTTSNADTETMAVEWLLDQSGCAGGP